jgi:hypothetical protein
MATSGGQSDQELQLVLSARDEATPQIEVRMRPSRLITGRAAVHSPWWSPMESRRYKGTTPLLPRQQTS